MGREKEPQAEISRRQFIRAMTVGAAAQILSGADGAYNLLRMPENNGKPGDGRVSFGMRLIVTCFCLWEETACIRKENRDSRTLTGTMMTRPKIANIVTKKQKTTANIVMRNQLVRKEAL